MFRMNKLFYLLQIDAKPSPSCSSEQSCRLSSLPRKTRHRRRSRNDVLLRLFRTNSGLERRHSDPELLLHAHHLHRHRVVLHHLLLLRSLRDGRRHFVPLLSRRFGEKRRNSGQVIYNKQVKNL